MGKANKLLILKVLNNRNKKQFYKNMQNKFQKCLGKIMKNNIYKINNAIRVNRHKIYKKLLNHLFFLKLMK